LLPWQLLLPEYLWRHLKAPVRPQAYCLRRNIIYFTFVRTVKAQFTSAPMVCISIALLSNVTDHPQTFPQNPETESDEEKADKSNCVGKYPILDPTICNMYLRINWFFCHIKMTNFNKFSCSNSTPIILSCPPGLHFHEAEQICNWLWIANCPW